LKILQPSDAFVELNEPDEDTNHGMMSFTEVSGDSGREVTSNMNTEWITVKGKRKERISEK
jgi:hypothetical protein